MARNMVKGGILNAVSIGFIPNQDKMVTKDVDGIDIPVYEETELVEVSLVTVPANPNAVALVRSLQSFIPSPAKAADADGHEAKQALALATWAMKLRLYGIAGRNK